MPLRAAILAAVLLVPSGASPARGDATTVLQDLTWGQGPTEDMRPPEMYRARALRDFGLLTEEGSPLCEILERRLPPEDPRRRLGGQEISTRAVFCRESEEQPPRLSAIYVEGTMNYRKVEVQIAELRRKQRAQQHPELTEPRIRQLREVLEGLPTLIRFARATYGDPRIVTLERPPAWWVGDRRELVDGAPRLEHYRWDLGPLGRVEAPVDPTDVRWVGLLYLAPDGLAELAMRRNVAHEKRLAAGP